MKRTLLFLSTFFASMTFAQDCSDLFISEYVEGWSNNKALEIYNPTDAAIDLSDYVIIRYSNGATTAGSDRAVVLSGTIDPYDVYVAVIDKRDTAGTQQEAPVWDSLQAKADGFYCPDYNVSQAMYFNGDDAVVLAKGSLADVDAETAQVVDIFGKIGEDPGDAWTSDFPYTGAGVEVTKDHSMIRKSTVLLGETNPIISFFDPLDQYDSIPATIQVGGLTQGNWSTLGSHTCDCAVSSVNEVATIQTSIFPNPSTGEFFVNGEFKSVSIVNSIGQTVAEINNNTKSVVSFDLGSKRGVYFVKVTNNDGSQITKRVIIK
ncbi:MAG: lamin tail domain-containing protein [Crocinitomicaceae bacterium]|nr:lamin tail domain-containing protein [Crocinitomicaceae bacterium]